MIKAKKENVKRKWGIDKIVTLAILVLAVVLAVSLIPLGPQGEQILIADETGSEVFRALYTGGITSSNTLVEGDLVRVSYQLPPTIKKENAELFILGVLSSLVPNKQKAVIAAYSGEDKVGEIEVQMEDVLKYRNKQTSLDQFRTRFKT